MRIAWRPLRQDRGKAWTIGWLLQTKALIMITFVSILFDKQMITGRTFTALLPIAGGSTMLTIPIVTPAPSKHAETSDCS